jgi:hypothetical protein
MMYIQYSRPMCGIYLCHTTQHTTQIPPSHIPLPSSTHIRNNNDNNGGDGNAKGDDRSNVTVVGLGYS